MTRRREPKKNLTYLRAYEEEIIIRDLRDLCSRTGHMVTVRELRMAYPMRYSPTMTPSVLKRMHASHLIARTHFAVRSEGERGYRYGPPVANAMRRAA